MSTLRLFIAIDMPAGVAQALHDAKLYLASAGADVRWEAREKYHCTLLFLGDTPEDALEALAAGVAAAAQRIHPFPLAYGGVGFFPNRDRPRVVWGGVTDTTGLLETLQARVVAAASALLPVLPAEGYRPHVTLGRVRSERNLPRLIQRSESCTFEHPPVTHHEVHIVQSRLEPGGSVHRILRTTPLGG
jgi:RNA 2',3'-cyclic 3'-phosphodiesterase